MHESCLHPKSIQTDVYFAFFGRRFFGSTDFPSFDLLAGQQYMVYVPSYYIQKQRTQFIAVASQNIRSQALLQRGSRCEC